MKIKHLLFSIIMLLLGNCSLIAKTLVNNNLDSLKNVQVQLYPDTTSEEYVKTLDEIAKVYAKDGQFRFALITTQKALQIANAEEYEEKKFQLQKRLGFYYYRLSDYQEALSTFQKTLQNKGQFVTNRDLAQIYNQMGSTFYYMGNLESAYNYQLQALRIYEILNDPILIRQHNFGISMILLEQEKYREALEIMKKSLELYKNTSDSVGISDCYSILGDVYYAMDSLKQALLYQQLSFKRDSLSNYKYGMGYGYFALGLTTAKMGNNELAMELHQKSLLIREEIEDREEMAQSLSVIGVLYHKMGNRKMALKQLSKSLVIAQELGSKLLIRDIYEDLMNFYFTEKNFEKAYEFQQNFHLLKDSLFNEKTTQNIANLDNHYQLEKKQQEIILLTQNKQLSDVYWKLSIVGIFVLLILLWAGKQYYNEQVKMTILLEEQNSEIEIKNQGLERANEDLEQFAYICSHDLKAPLRTIGSYAKFIERRYKNKLDETGLEFLGFITGGVEHMNTLLLDVYEYTKLEKTSLELKTVDLNLLSERIIHNLNFNIQEKQAKITIDILPKIMGNSSLLGQVFQNIIVNSMKFMPPNTTPQIHVSATEMDDKVKISIKDNGIGIKEESQDKIFTIFRRLHTDAEYEGTGIGLAICKKIVERQGGQIWVESDGKNGSTFCFTLQRA